MAAKKKPEGAKMTGLTIRFLPEQMEALRARAELASQNERRVVSVGEYVRDIVRRLLGAK